MVRGTSFMAEHASLLRSHRTVRKGGRAFDDIIAGAGRRLSDDVSRDTARKPAWRERGARGSREQLTKRRTRGRIPGHREENSHVARGKG